MESVKGFDPEVYSLIKQEERRQADKSAISLMQ